MQAFINNNVNAPYYAVNSKPSSCTTNNDILTCSIKQNIQSTKIGFTSSTIHHISIVFYWVQHLSDFLSASLFIQCIDPNITPDFM